MDEDFNTNAAKNLADFLTATDNAVSSWRFNPLTHMVAGIMAHMGPAPKSFLFESLPATTALNLEGGLDDLLQNGLAEEYVSGEETHYALTPIGQQALKVFEQGVDQALSTETTLEKIDALVDEQGWDEDQTYLYFLAAASDLLDLVSLSIRDGHSALANYIDKLQQDVGVQIAGAWDSSAGPESKALASSFDFVTPARLKMLTVAQSLISDPELAKELSELIKTLPVAVTPPPPSLVEKPQP